jgi:hypothetical protein
MIVFSLMVRKRWRRSIHFDRILLGRHILFLKELCARPNRLASTARANAMPYRVDGGGETSKRDN